MEYVNFIKKIGCLMIGNRIIDRASVCVTVVSVSIADYHPY